MVAAPQITEALDDVGPVTGAVHYGEYTNDNAPVIRVALGDQAAAGQSLSLRDGDVVVGSGVTLSATDVSRGYVDVPLAGLSSDWHQFTAVLKGAGGTDVASSMVFALGVATSPPPAPTITSAESDGGAAVSYGAHTADTTPTLHIFEPGLPAAPTSSPGHAPFGGPALMGGTIQIFDGDTLVGQARIGYDGAVTVTTDPLSPGEHMLRAVAVDRAGNVSPVSAPFDVVIGPGAPAGGQTGAGAVLAADVNAGSVTGGSGADTLLGGAADATLHGGAGNDSITGGAAFNAVNGNTGDDTIMGHSAVGDWLLGGQGQDSINAAGSTGHNIINGNLGFDTLAAGSGGDTVRGGQADDLVMGGAGADWISGDLGNDTVSGGGGADTFHAGGGVDSVTDFNLSQGDRILVDHGVSVQAHQTGTDVTLDLSDGGELVLRNLRLDALGPTSGWIFTS